MVDVLVVERREELSQRLKQFLERQPGVQVRVAAECTRGDTEAGPALIVFDLNAVLPDGFDVWRIVRRARQQTRVPFVLLRSRSGVSSVSDAVFETLNQRLRVALRQRPAGPAACAGGTHAAAGHGAVLRSGARLTRREADLLDYLITHTERIVGRDELFDQFWGYETRSLDVHIRRLRQKLDSTGATIRTVSGVGYHYTAQPTREP